MSAWREALDAQRLSDRVEAYQRASPEAVAAREAEYDRIAPRWRNGEFQLRARARLNCVDHALFQLNHDDQTARFIESFSSYGTHSAPFIGITAQIEPRGDYTDPLMIVGHSLRLMEFPFKGDVVYRIVP